MKHTPYLNIQQLKFNLNVMRHMKDDGRDFDVLNTIDVLIIYWERF